LLLIAPHALNGKTGAILRIAFWFKTSFSSWIFIFYVTHHYWQGKIWQMVDKWKFCLLHKPYGKSPEVVSDWHSDEYNVVNARVNSEGNKKEIQNTSDYHKFSNTHCIPTIVLGIMLSSRRKRGQTWSKCRLCPSEL
jgi:hypothetical protein